MDNLSSSFPIFMKKNNKDGSSSSSLQKYRVCYDEGKMQQFLDGIKLQYTQKYKDYDTMDDIKILQGFSIIDELETHQKDVEGRFGAPDIYYYRYKRYPAIYKILLNSLKAETFSLDIFVDYYKKIKENGDLSLYSDSHLIAYLSKKTAEEIEQATYFHEHRDRLKFYNDKELGITREEYKEILKEYLSLIKMKRAALSFISVDTMRLAIRHKDSLIYDDLFDDTIIAKKFRKI